VSKLTTETIPENLILRLAQVQPSAATRSRYFRGARNRLFFENSQGEFSHGLLDFCTRVLPLATGHFAPIMRDKEGSDMPPNPLVYGAGFAALLLWATLTGTPTGGGGYLYNLLK
jgi:hypothetical protein